VAGYLHRRRVASVSASPVLATAPDVARAEENIAADLVVLTRALLKRLDNLTPVAGARRSDANMATIDR
jgi:hypothetical protein